MLGPAGAFKAGQHPWACAWQGVGPTSVLASNTTGPPDRHWEGMRACTAGDRRRGWGWPCAPAGNMPRLCWFRRLHRRLCSSSAPPPAVDVIAGHTSLRVGACGTGFEGLDPGSGMSHDPPERPHPACWRAVSSKPPTCKLSLTACHLACSTAALPSPLCHRRRCRMTRRKPPQPRHRPHHVLSRHRPSHALHSPSLWLFSPLLNLDPPTKPQTPWNTPNTLNTHHR